MEASWSHRGALSLGAILEASTAFLVLSWGHLRLLGRPWGALGALLEAFEALLGPSWRHPGPSWDSLGTLLRISWGPLGGLEGPSIKEGGGSLTSGPENEPLGALLGRSWGGPGRSWGDLGALLGPSWGPLGPSWSHLEASRAHRTRKGENAKNIEKHNGFGGFWPLEGFPGGLARHLEPS